MAFTEDFSIFINDDTPGYRQLQIDSVAVNGIYVEPFQESGFVESSGPAFWVKSEDVSSATVGADVLDASTSETWDVIGFEPDGSGITKLNFRQK